MTTTDFCLVSLFVRSGGSSINRQEMAALGAKNTGQSVSQPSTAVDCIEN